MAIRVLIADDHGIVRQGLLSFLTLDAEIEVVGMATDGAEAVELAHKLLPDIVLMDLIMPRVDGLEATRLIRNQLPSVKVLMLTSLLDRESIMQAIRAGISGYLLKTTSAEQLCQAVRAVASGQVQLAPQAALLLIENVATSPVVSKAGVAAPAQAVVEPIRLRSTKGLTEREIQVLQWLAQGKSNKEIAYNLSLAEKTVKNHVSIILAKLGMQSRTQAAIYATSHELAS